MSTNRIKKWWQEQDYETRGFIKGIATITGVAVTGCFVIHKIRKGHVKEAVKTVSVLVERDVEPIDKPFNIFITKCSDSGLEVMAHTNALSEKEIVPAMKDYAKAAAAAYASTADENEVPW